MSPWKYPATNLQIAPSIMHSIAWRRQNSQVKAALRHPCLWALVFHLRKLSSPQKVLHNSRPISLGDSLNRWYLRQNKVSLIEFMRVHPFVKSILHSSMIQLPMIHSSQSLSLSSLCLAWPQPPPPPRESSKTFLLSSTFSLGRYDELRSGEWYL